MDYKPEQFLKAIESLPEEFQDAISNSFVSNKTNEIGKRHGFSEEQLSKLANTSILAIIKLVEIKNLPSLLSSEIGIEPGVAQKITNEIKNEIVGEIEDKIKKAELEKKKSEEESEKDERFESLPGDIQEAITSAEVGSKVAALAQKYKLHIDKASELSDETGLVMLGITHPQDFLGNIKRRLQLPEDMARDLVSDVNEQIFKSIRGSLKKIHQMAEDEATAQKESVSSVYSSISQPPANQMTPLPLTKEVSAETPEIESVLGSEDSKILADSGIEIDNSSRPTPYDLQEKQNIENNTTPNKAELINALENPESIKSNGISMPAGFSMQKATPITPTMGQKESIPETKTQPQIQAEKKVDPYRELV